MTDFNFEPKRVLKHKNHVTVNSGETYQEKVQHLEYKPDQDKDFVELKNNEAAMKYGSKKLVRELDLKSRDDLGLDDPGIGKTPEWFKHLIPVIEWDEYRTLLYEIEHLWLSMFFVRELYGEEGTGREQIIEIVRNEEGEFGLDVVCQIDYVSGSHEGFDKDEASGLFELTLKDVNQSVEEVEDEGVEFDTTFKQTFFDGADESVVAGLREILAGIALKHGYDDEQLVLDFEEAGNGEYIVDVLNKDFKVRFSESGTLDTDVGHWVVELFRQDGCPLSFDQVEVTDK